MSEALDRYFRTYAGRELLKKHRMSEEGLWQVKGEDPNCDMAGSHYQPNLGYYKGKLEDVISYGITLSGFWQWGAGGEFLKVEYQEIDTPEFRHKQNLWKEREKIESRLKEIKSALKEG